MAGKGMDPSMMTQMQIRNNAKDLQELWADLNEWEDEMKAKDKKLIDGEDAGGSTGFFDLLDDDGDLLMDINPEVMQGEELKEHATKVSRKFVEENQEALAAKEQRIKPKTYQEYNKWDKFNVDEQLKIFDEKERKEKQEREKKAALDSRRKEAEKRRKKKDKKELALDLKEEGNDAFKKGDFQEALDCYTLSLAENALSFQTFCNRAMVLLKLDRAADAEADGDKAIKLNPKFTKAYMRRGAAREAQGKLKEALEDYEHAKVLEPANKETRKMIRHVKNALGMEVEEEVEKIDPYEEATVEVVEYGSDSDYDLVETSTEEPKSNEVQHTVEAREMPAHLKRKGALAIPQNATQFEQVWNDALGSDMTGRAAYLRAITPAKLGALLKEGVEADLFSSILLTAESFMLMEEAVDVLVALAKTKRFDMNMMMATAADKAAAAAVIESAAAVGDAASAAVLRGLRKKYEVA